MGAKVNARVRNRVNAGVSVESLLKVGNQPVKLGSLLVVVDLNSQLKLETLETRITFQVFTSSIHSFSSRGAQWTAEA